MSVVVKRSGVDRITDTCLYVFLTLFTLATLFPLYYVFIMSITPFTEVLRNGGFIALPKQITWDAYKEIFSSTRVPNAMWVTVQVTVVGTTLNLIVTSLLAYALSKKFVPYRNIILLAIIFTMLFNGGMIPTFLVVRGIGLYDTIWAMIIPGMVSTFYLLIMKTYFENLPDELIDAANVDGCGDISTLLYIVLPLSMPIMATLGLFYGVGHWNEYFKGIMYVSSNKLQPIQVVLRNMIQTPNISQELAVTNTMDLIQLPPETVKMATVTVALLPIMAIYPFLQRFFIKGMLIGAIKG
jgi:putative aldouronate transport system permease protein